MMKKIYILATAAALCAGMASAQETPQLPNADFEGAWNDCVPWTSNGNTKTIGVTPADWRISHVIGISGTGKTEVGGKETGYNGQGSAVKVVNSPNSVKKTQTVPGYVTLGTTWSTAKGFNGGSPDGGTFGGIDFKGRPESITFVYKRTHGTANPDEKASVVAYLWKGEYEQANVPGEISLVSPKTVNMVDRDRNILDMATAQGGDVTKKGTLIGKINYDITGDADDWKELTIPFEYLTDDTPEKFNIIFCAGDYFSTSPGAGNALYIDNVKLNYPAKVLNTKTFTGLLTVSLDGNPQPMENQNVYLDELSNGKYRLRLVNFGGDDQNPEGMGTIIVDVTIENGNISGTAKNITLAGGIEADATVSGTLNGNDLDLAIAVEWIGHPELPISVTFKGSLTSNVIDAIVDDANAEAVYYNLNGMEVKGDLTPGIYVKRQGAKATKVLVK